MSIALANLRILIGQRLAEVFKPSPPIDYEAWAVKNISFSSRESDFSGPFNPTFFPYFSEIYRALGPDDPCRIVTLKKSAQLGGTILANVFVLGTQDLDPCEFFYVHPSEENAKRWVAGKLKPMLRSTACLAAAFPENSRETENKELYKERKDGRGSIRVAGANSAAGLSQITVSRQVQDDLAKWENNSAGDSEGQADSRSEGRELAKIFKVSTPLLMPGCKITRNFENGSQEFFYVPCPQCGHEQTLDIENFLGNLDETEPEKTHFTCIECGFPIEEHHRPAMLKKGRWIARNPDAARYHRSFYIWSGYSRLQSFERIARKWLAARGFPDKERVFYNDAAGIAYQVKGEAPPWEDLRTRAETGGHVRRTIPASGLILTVGLDVQGDWFAWQAVAWTRDGRRHVVDYARIEGFIGDVATYPKHDALLASKWRHESGAEIGVDLLAIDGNAWTEAVWNWARRHPTSKVIMVRGVDGDDKPLIAKVKRERNKAGKLLKYQSRFYNFATSILKWSLYRNLPKVDVLENGYVGLPGGMGDNYFRELTAEKRVEEKDKRGFSRFVWINDPGQRNEALDTMCQAEAAAIKFGVRDLPPAAWDRFEAERTKRPENAQLDLEDMMHLPPSPVAQPAIPQQPKPRRTLADMARGFNGGNR